MEIKTIGKDKVFIPEFNDNKSLPPAKQIRVTFKSFPAAGDMGSYKKEYYKSGSRIVEYNDISLLITCVEKIENLTYNGIEIKTAVQLIAADKLLFPLVEEVRYYAMREEELLTEGESSASK